jgi:cell division protein FtsW
MSSPTMHARRNHIDLSILIGVLMLMVISLAVVYSASATWALEKFGESARLLGSHALKVLVGFAMIFIFMNIDYKKLRRFTKPVLIISLLILIVTLALGGEVKGASRWLRFGGFSFQPSELAKYALLFHLALLMSLKQDRIREFKTGFLPLMVWIGAVTLFVLLQPNFSTGAMIVAVSFVMLYVAGAKVGHMAGAVATALPLLMAYMMSASYRRARILGFLSGAADQLGTAGYQRWQGIIGFGSGGIFGLGPGASRQRDFFLPESFGDFVFSILGEEYGLIGTICIMAIFLIIMLRGLKIAKHAQDDFGRYLAVGITSTITLFALTNAAVTLGILPTTGLPMPFISYGGSSFLFSSIAIGVLLNISSQTGLHPRATRVRGETAAVGQVPAVGKVH